MEGVTDATLQQKFASINARIYRAPSGSHHPPEAHGIDHAAFPALDPGVHFNMYELLGIVNAGGHYVDATSTVRRDPRWCYRGDYNESHSMRAPGNGLAPAFIRKRIEHPTETTYCICMQEGNSLSGALAYHVVWAQDGTTADALSCDFVLAAVKGQGAFMMGLLEDIASLLSITLLTLETLDSIRAYNASECARFYAGNAKVGVSSLSGYFRGLGFTHRADARTAPTTDLGFPVNPLTRRGIMSKRVGGGDADACAVLPRAPNDPAILSATFHGMYRLVGFVAITDGYEARWERPAKFRANGPSICVSVCKDGGNANTKMYVHTITWTSRPVTGRCTFRSGGLFNRHAEATIDGSALQYLGRPPPQRGVVVHAATLAVEQAEREKQVWFHRIMGVIDKALIYDGLTAVTTRDFRSVISYVTDYFAEIPVGVVAVDTAPALVGRFMQQYKLVGRSMAYVRKGTVDPSPEMWDRAPGVYTCMTWRMASGRPDMVHVCARVNRGQATSCMVEWDTAMPGGTSHHRRVCAFPGDMPQSGDVTFTGHENAAMGGFMHIIQAAIDAGEGAQSAGSVLALVG